MEKLRSIYKTIERFWTPDVCVQCHDRCFGGYYATTKEGYKLVFCTIKCGDDYWEEYGKFGRNPKAFMQQGPRICHFPGCTKPCYREGNKVHDYCGRTHAQQHGAMASAHGGGGSGRGRTTGYARQGSGSYSPRSGWRNHTGPIYFYNRDDPYYEFTNFYQAVVNIDGQDWLTTEHYFQAQKFVGTPLVRTIRLMERPRDAFDKSRDPRYSHWRRSDWEEVKENIMFKALQAKFTQHEKLKKLLLSTGDRELVERSPYDSYWGDGGDGSGKNKLGILLMTLRDDLTPKPAPFHQPKPHPTVRAPSPQPLIHPGPPHSSSPVNSSPQKMAPEPTEQKIEEWCEMKPLSDLQQPEYSEPPAVQHAPDRGRDEQYDDGPAPQPTEHHQLDPHTPSQFTNPIVQSSDATSMHSSQPQTQPKTMMQVTMTPSPSPSGGQHPTTSPTVTPPFNDLASTSSAGPLQSSEKPGEFIDTFRLTPTEDLDRHYIIRDRIPGSGDQGSTAGQPQSHTSSVDDTEDMDITDTDKLIN